MNRVFRFVLCAALLLLPATLKAADPADDPASVVGDAPWRGPGGRRGLSSLLLAPRAARGHRTPARRRQAHARPCHRTLGLQREGG